MKRKKILKSSISFCLVAVASTPLFLSGCSSGEVFFVAIDNLIPQKYSPLIAEKKLPKGTKTIDEVNSLWSNAVKRRRRILIDDLILFISKDLNKEKWEYYYYEISGVYSSINVSEQKFSFTWTEDYIRLPSPGEQFWAEIINTYEVRNCPFNISFDNQWLISTALLKDWMKNDTKWQINTHFVQKIGRNVVHDEWEKYSYITPDKFDDAIQIADQKCSFGSYYLSKIELSD